MDSTKKSKFESRFPEYQCKACDNPLTFVEEYQAWYCHTCKQWTDEQEQEVIAQQSHRGGESVNLPTKSSNFSLIGGILLIVAGAIGMVVYFTPLIWLELDTSLGTIIFYIISIALSLFVIVGGVIAIKKKSWRFALSSSIVGILFILSPFFSLVANIGGGQEEGAVVYDYSGIFLISDIFLMCAIMSTVSLVLITLGKEESHATSRIETSERQPPQSSKRQPRPDHQSQQSKQQCLQPQKSKDIPRPPRV